MWNPFIFLFRQASHFESDEVALAREQVIADAEDPNWDRSSRVTTAAGALKRGMPRELLEAVYGHEILREAEAIATPKSAIG